MPDFKISNIKYDTTEISDLPLTLTVNLQDDLSSEEIEQGLSEAISNKTGFCHKGFDFMIIGDESLLSKLEKAGITSDDLEETVSDAAEREATRINNEGLKEQIAYLEREGMPKAAILDAPGLE
jgi:hypothetical protein